MSNFFEVFVVEPLPGKSFTDSQIIKDLQWILDQAAAGIEGISFQFRKSVDNPNQLLLSACWTSIEGHDDLDLRCITPKMLKVLMANVVPVSIYFFFMDASKVDYQAQVWTVEAFHVKKEDKEKFETEVEKEGLAGGWYVTKKIPPRPTVMPTDPALVKIIEAGEERARARLSVPNPDTWITISSGPPGSRDFGSTVRDWVSIVDRRDWEKYLVGSSFLPLS